MSITSLNFIAFLVVLTLLYYVIPRRFQWPLLLAGSIYFYVQAGWKAVVFVLTTAILTYAAALWMERENNASKNAVSKMDSRDKKAEERERNKKHKRHFFILFCIVIFGIWAVVKYSSMVLATVQGLFPQADLSRAFAAADSFIVPLGISFYTFNAAGYVIDVSRRKYPAEKNFLKVLLYIIFFPHIIQGPFSRYDRLGKTLFQQHYFDYDRMAHGMARILYGYFQKLLIADKLSPTVTQVMQNPGEYGSAALFVAVIGYGIQLYCDFSGYMNIMTGFCEVLGITLEENFAQPYFSTSIQNYWTRWHITLGHWYSDYVFYPCSMGKTAQKIGRKARERFGARMGKLLPSYFSMIFVWTLTGLWHGASWTFVVWGWLNFAIIVFSMQADLFYTRIKELLHINDKCAAWRIVMIVRTFVLVSLLRIFYCSNTVAGALRYISLMLRPGWGQLAHPVNLLLTAWADQKITLAYILFGTAVVFCVDLVHEKNIRIRVPAFLRGLGYGFLFCLILIGAGQGNGGAGGFMYAQF